MVDKRFRLPVLIVATLLLIGIGGWSITRAEKVSSIGFVDTARLANEYPEMKAMRQQLEKQTASLQSEYDKSSANLSQEEKVKLFQKYQADLDAKKETLVSAALAKAMQTVSDVAKEQGLTVVLEKQAVLFGGKDITNDVLHKAEGSAKSK